METPVVLIIFKRPDTTQKVLESIRQVKPSKLFVIADGPRKDRLGEEERCTAARSIIDGVNWDCEVIKNYSDTNLGCKIRVSTGLDWVFEQIEEAIILEDDCVPNISFFPYCEELLKYYRFDTRIMSISAKNIQPNRNSPKFSYYFSRYHHCWGWATWRRAWKYYDFEMSLWPEVKSSNVLNNILHDQRAVKYWQKTFQKTYEGKVDAWDYRWTLACWLQSGLSILPSQNLVSNIGFGNEATNTITNSKNCPFANMNSKEILFPLKHPPYVVRDNIADSFEQNNAFDPKLITRAKSKIYRTFKFHND